MVVCMIISADLSGMFYFPVNKVVQTDSSAWLTSLVSLIWPKPAFHQPVSAVLLIW